MLLTQTPSIIAGIEAICKTEPRFKAALDTFGPLQFTKKPGGFSGLVRIILGQQVSVQSADAHWRKVEATFPDVTPAAIGRASEDDLRGCGLSRQKIRYIRELARDIEEERLDLDVVAGMDDEAAIASITRSVGLGRWTAENYLLFCEARPDMFPAKDLAILIGLEWLAGLPRRPTPEEAMVYAERWKPYRTAASLLIWHHYVGTLSTRRAAPK